MSTAADQGESTQGVHTIRLASVTECDITQGLFSERLAAAGAGAVITTLSELALRLRTAVTHPN